MDQTLARLHEDEMPKTGISPKSGGASVLVLELSPKRKAVIKKAFRRLDPTDRGYTTAEEITEALAKHSSLDAASRKELCGHLIQMASPKQGGTYTLATSGFIRYYQGVSLGVARDRDFEHILHMHWGFIEVNDILTSMQGHFAMAGLAYAYQDVLATSGSLASMTVQQFQAGLQKVGMNLSPEDLSRVLRAFDEDRGYLMPIQGLRDQMISGRPETPLPDLGGPSLQILAPAPAPALPPAPAPAPATRDLDFGALNTYGRMDIDWAALTKKLPYERTPEALAARKKLFRGCDINGNGYLSLAEVDKGIRDAIESDKIFHAKPAIMRAFQMAKNWGDNAKKGTHAYD
jgi:Ca2+-binding EF-hand superfamily protein